MKNKKIIDLAIKVAGALPLEHGKQRVSAIALDRKGNVLSVKTNNYTKTHTAQKRYAHKAGTPFKEYLHAEVNCLLTARTDVDTIIVARVNKQGKPLPAAPCPVCQIAIREYGVKHIVHT